MFGTANDYDEMGGNNSINGLIRFLDDDILYNVCTMGLKL